MIALYIILCTVKTKNKRKTKQHFLVQILNDKPDERQKDLTFIPLAPACVVRSIELAICF